ncbi:CDGSH iron-sulfur domain-containing protein [Actinomadura rugatobispora]|uniref:CDGSH iron-sulfur domain-containing protein n=1 Tax=Actinomadura rugatobispora TaxID=1994 RepID=A0ABW1A7H9_9ACTN|nr:CDGSH iron-sulfur domain-containing protein [Actinomadura rugatobispora]
MPSEPTRVTMVRGGPVLVEGPVEIVLEDGSVVTSDRFLVALCACGRSGRYPFCDTSHRAAPCAQESQDKD